MSSDRYLRREAVVLGEGSLIPPDNQIRPAPNRFTHDGGARCRVADGRGLHVEVSYESLTELEKP